MLDLQMATEVAVTARRGRLETRWVPVTDDRGLTRMQAVWIDAVGAARLPAHHAA